MPTVFLGLGSNVGDREGHLRHALRRLAADLELTGVSSVWETDPVGYEDQDRFLNLVARVETDAEPGALLDTLREIEAERGRERTFRNAPRTLDIDILLYGDRVIDERGLQVPHPRMGDRAFVLVPLLELGPDMTDPQTGERWTDRAGASSPEGMKRIMAGERLLNDGED